MQTHSLSAHQHSHNFNHDNSRAQKRTMIVLILTAVMMAGEIVAGTIYGSMALLADGWHMATHVAAFVITLAAYRFASKHATNPAYTFGVGKVTSLGGFASSVALTVVALMMAIESLLRMLSPQQIAFDQAIFVAIIGLTINLVCAVILKDEHHHGHSHGHGHHHGHSHHHEHGHSHDNHKHHGAQNHATSTHDEPVTDHNLKAAYLHVVTDALTSLFAIVALLAGKYAGLNWLDPIMGMVGSIIIARWAYGLIRQTLPILLDVSIHDAQKQKIINALESGNTKVVDFHEWQVASGKYAIIVSLVTSTQNPSSYYHQILNSFSELAHVTVEVQYCDVCV